MAEREALPLACSVSEHGVVARIEEGPMAGMTTKAGEDDVEAFLGSIPDESRRADARVVCDLLESVTGAPPVMWGKSIVGFGLRRLRYDDGREIDWMEIGFSPRKASTTIYLSGGVDHYADLLASLGRHTTGKGCLYLKRVDDADPVVLEAILARSVSHARAT
jgi:hypothetical protein